MQLNKVLKGLAIALPMFTLAACSSSESTDSSAASETNTGSTTEQSTVVTSPVEQEPVLSEQELRSQQLRQEQTIYFKFDNAEIQPDYQDMLTAHAEYLRDNAEVKVIVEGHADERGTPEYNIALGERRANAVAKYLQALGVSASQISIVSYGEEKPLVLGHTEADYAKNRRSVLVY
ncbi:peptidoglycan-associated lipoprotein Pal [Photobacterium gaetbulicola]|uniref:Peptidoglycan-associated lipoprotein n=2 Tax=Photobacterium gaetbulicola TaxID=1295392 RepID=A0A0C5WY75_9GAMM|nr:MULTISPECIES: peptidoglycan-associated lipoprotein Pal [Photobacterium]AJR08010.1 putative peptidoglycan-associated lipoprotein [Photobacterium gaetbulicola Gung47]KHT64641.1 lipoprotein [Photobacterium gaetbulicola]PSU07771.1 peptidoglycan-associated lipoprotein Pal [Photobacterium gaetbulicola]WEM43210.1 peptidoglycan-associated lipoprotein Pal [Photobacterium sp. DA100]